VNTVASGFIDEVRADSELTRIASTIEHALAMIDAEGDGSADAAALWEGISYIISHADRTVEERLRAIVKLLSLRGPVEIIDLRDFLGWNTN
jgi:hypothetical protein